MITIFLHMNIITRLNEDKLKQQMRFGSLTLSQNNIHFTIKK